MITINDIGRELLGESTALRPAPKPAGFVRREPHIEDAPSRLPRGAGTALIAAWLTTRVGQEVTREALFGIPGITRKTLTGYLDRAMPRGEIERLDRGVYRIVKAPQAPQRGKDPGPPLPENLKSAKTGCMARVLDHLLIGGALLRGELKALLAPEFTSRQVEQAVCRAIYVGLIAPQAKGRLSRLALTAAGHDRMLDRGDRPRPASSAQPGQPAVRAEPPSPTAPLEATKGGTEGEQANAGSRGGPVRDTSPPCDSRAATRQSFCCALFSDGRLLLDVDGHAIYLSVQRTSELRKFLEKFESIS